MEHPFPHEVKPRFRRMLVSDLDYLMRIEEVSFPTPWSKGTYRRELTRGHYGSYWVVVPGREVNGSVPPILSYGGMWRTGEEAHVTTIAVHPKWRRRGLGAWTLLQLIGVARASGSETVTLEVRVSNQAAISLYEKLGFETVGKRKGYYIDTREDALLMTLASIHHASTWEELQRERIAIEAQGKSSDDDIPGDANL